MLPREILSLQSNGISILIATRLAPMASEPRQVRVSIALKNLGIEPEANLLIRSMTGSTTGGRTPIRSATSGTST